jgi:predicted Rdx family selenoprotein
VKAWIEARGLGNVEIQAGRIGQFDIVIDGNVAYSRRETGRFPAETDLESIRF